MSLAHQVRKYWRELAAIIAILALALAVGGFILTKQRLRYPWDDIYTIKGEFSTAIGVTPGQAQPLNVAGVEVGEISEVKLEGGRALISMEVERDKLAHVYKDARMLLRPKTGLNDMSVELWPGSRKAGELEDGGTVPLARTRPDVRLDEVLASLDQDTRAWMRVMLNDGGRALTDRGVDLRKIFRATQPTLRDARRVTQVVADRRAKVKRVVRNLRVLVEATAEKDDELARLVRSGATTFGALAEREGELRSSLDQLPPTLATARSALQGVQSLSGELQPTLSALQPTLARLPGALEATDPLLREARPFLARELRPLVRQLRPLSRDLKPTVSELSAVTPSLTRVFTTLNYVVNELGYNPPGKEEGYLFWLSWFAHNANSMLGSGDAHGNQWRGIALVSCSTLSSVLPSNPLVGLLLGAGSPLCPELPDPGAQQQSTNREAGGR